jgi:hypothetical protein
MVDMSRNLWTRSRAADFIRGLERQYGTVRYARTNESALTRARSIQSYIKIMESEGKGEKGESPPGRREGKGRERARQEAEKGEESVEGAELHT